MLKLILFLKHLKRFKFKRFYNDQFKKQPLMLHIGCGRKYKAGWINIDNNSDKNIEKLDINYNLAKGIPFKDNSIDFIYNEHFIEHLTVEQGLYFFKECNRTLKKGGVLRVATPDLSSVIDCYLDNNWKENAMAFFQKYGLSFIKTRAEYMNISFRWWGHQWLYDKEELERRLKEAGFNNIKFCELNKSEHEELKNIETRSGSRLIAEVTKE